MLSVMPLPERPSPRDDSPERGPQPIGPDIEQLLRRYRDHLSAPHERPVPLNVPVPPNLAEAFGYRGDACVVGFWWEPAGDELVFEDGRTFGTGDPWAFLAYRRHSAVALHLDPYNTGYSDVEAEHALVLDRERDRMSVAAIATARPFLKQQHPPPPDLTPQEIAKVQQRIDDALRAGWQEVRIDQEEIARAMQEQRERMAAMVAYLDRWQNHS
jgi:hypothetical protein